MNPFPTHHASIVFANGGGTAPFFPNPCASSWCAHCACKWGGGGQGPESTGYFNCTLARRAKDALLHVHVIGFKLSASRTFKIQKFKLGKLSNSKLSKLSNSSFFKLSISHGRQAIVLSNFEPVEYSNFQTRAGVELQTLKLQNCLTVKLAASRPPGRTHDLKLQTLHVQTVKL